MLPDEKYGDVPEKAGEIRQNHTPFFHQKTCRAPGLSGEQLKGPSNRAATERAIAPGMVPQRLDGLFGKSYQNG